MLSNSHKLNAIAWKADSEGMSYGRYCQNLSDQEKEMIYEQYELLLKKRKEQEEARLALAHEKFLKNKKEKKIRKK